MLKIWVKGFRDDCMLNPSSYFNRRKSKDWFDRKDVRDIIYLVDNARVVNGECIEYLEKEVGCFSPYDLSNSCKVCILECIEPGCNPYIFMCDDKVFRGLLELAKSKDVVVTMHHMPNKIDVDFKIKLLDTGRVVKDLDELREEYGIITGQVKKEGVL